MAKTTRAKGGSAVQIAQKAAAEVAEALGIELVEVAYQKESRGKCLLIYIDKEGGVSLDDCERYHKRVQPMLEALDYDFLEVSSPGLDRPVKTLRDFQKNRGAVVEIKLFAARDGVKSFRGRLTDMDEESVAITDAQDALIRFERKTVALIKPVIELEEEDFEGVQGLDEIEAVALADDENGEA